MPMKPCPSHRSAAGMCAMCPTIELEREQKQRLLIWSNGWHILESFHRLHPLKLVSHQRVLRIFMAIFFLVPSNTSIEYWELQKGRICSMTIGRLAWLSFSSWMVSFHWNCWMAAERTHEKDLNPHFMVRHYTFSPMEPEDIRRKSVYFIELLCYWWYILFGSGIYCPFRFDILHRKSIFCETFRMADGWQPKTMRNQMDHA